ncbi:MAG: arginine--tRNA ligase [Clostridia bacterium]|nr:arginine--tRNA ligase [Clostridia bacterium]
MNTIIQILSDACGQAFEACGYDPSLGAVTVSDRPDICQFQCNGALQGAKLYKMPPFKIANAVVEELKGDKSFSKVEMAMPGFINFTLDDAFLAEYLNGAASDKDGGMPQILSGKKILIDYGGPNVAKPLHVGHLRSAIIGEAIKRIARAAGAEAVGDTHLGDWGLQMGLVITELKVRHPEWRCFADDFDPEKDEIPEITLEELNEVYPCASAKSKVDPDYSARAHEATVLLQQKHPGYYALFKSFMKVSVDDMKKIYDRLNVSFEYWYGESDADEYIPELFEILEDKGLIEESEGALVVKVARESDDAPMPPVIVKKSDGSNIYATTDLATILWRMKEFAPDGIWYVVDKRQGLHFTQVFRCAEKAGLIDNEAVCEHLGFGTMNGLDGKPFKTRDGDVLPLTVLLDNAYYKALEGLDSDKFESEEKRRQTADRLSVASVKFGDLINNRQKDYIFDPDRFLSAEGKTGVYLLYSVTRISSLLNKAGEVPPDGLDPECEICDAERSLMLALSSVGEYFTNAVNERCPNYIAEAAYQIAATFSGFYHDVRILSEKDDKKRLKRLALCRMTRDRMKYLLDLLAIETVDVM